VSEPRPAAAADAPPPPARELLLLGDEDAATNLPRLLLVLGGQSELVRVDIDPPARRVLPLPAGLAFVVADAPDSMPGGPALEAAREERLIGARLAAALLANEIGLEVGNPPRLRDVADVDVVDLLADGLPDRASVREVARAVEVEPARLAWLDPGAFDQVAKVPVRRYARHLLGEARRVEEAEAPLQSGDPAAFGAVLNASHESLRTDYRASTPEVDRLCAAMRRAGAFGVRLAGASAGGYAVAAVAPGRAGEVVAAAEAATGGRPAIVFGGSGQLS
jgi:galactokinase